MTSFWSTWIILLTVVTLVALTWVLFANRTRDDSGDRTTGHVYDGIEELDNPLPAWWFYMFVITIVWGIGVGTLMTLFMIPALYTIIVEDIAGLFRRRGEGRG